MRGLFLTVMLKDVKQDYFTSLALGLTIPLIIILLIAVFTLLKKRR